MRTRLGPYFLFTELGADWRTEILAGVTTATCLASAIGCFLMGTLAESAIWLVVRAVSSEAH